MGKFIKSVFILVIIFGIIIAAGYFKYTSELNSPIGSNPVKKVFEIEEGATGDQVLAKLASEGIISPMQQTVLRIFLRLEKFDPFKEGTYKIPLNISPKDILSVLQNPELTDIWITIPEGLRKDEIASLIAKEYEGVEGAVFSKEEFLAFTTDATFIETMSLPDGIKDLEGFLFPDKYLVPAQATTEYILDTLISTFKEKAGDISYSTLIIASMLEREGKSDTDRPMIADVISKRLKEGWLLQIDATLLYYYKDWRHAITPEDKKVNQPYNTYAKIGLPPTPICNPGLSSINAAKAPKSNSYYYYIHANDGNVYFAKTLAEHNANIAKYLR